MESPPTSRALKRPRLTPPGNEVSEVHPSCPHAPRCRRPLLVASVYDAADLSRVGVRLVDVASGAAVARLDGLSSGSHCGAAGGLVCLVGDRAAVRVLDPATGAATDVVLAAPGDATAAAAAHGHGQRTSPPSHVFGQVPSTGEYKLLRIDAAGSPGHQSQSCEILTIGAEQPRWRPAQSPPAPVAALAYRNKAVVRGVAHFLPSSPSHHGDGIASFDLGAEAWRPSLLHVPLSSSGGGGRHVFRPHLSLAELGGRLAAVHHDYQGGSIDVWLLADLETGTWMRTHSLRLASVLRGWGAPPPGEVGPRRVVAGDRESLAQPVAVLDDGRIALWVEGKGLLRVYDPTSGGCTDVADLGRFSNVIGLCTAAIGDSG